MVRDISSGMVRHIHTYTYGHAHKACGGSGSFQKQIVPLHETATHRRSVSLERHAGRAPAMEILPCIQEPRFRLWSLVHPVTSLEGSEQPCLGQQELDSDNTLVDGRIAEQLAAPPSKVCTQPRPCCLLRLKRKHGNLQGP